MAPIPGAPKVSLPTKPKVNLPKIKTPLSNTPLDPNKLISALNGKSRTANTPADPSTYAIDNLTGGSSSKQRSTVGDQIPTPTLANRVDMSSLGDQGLIKASTISGSDIQKQMDESPWLRAAMQKQASEQSMLLDQANRNSMAGSAQARAALAAKGGLRTGAAERLAGASGNDLALMRQNILGQGALERGNLGMTGANLATDISRFNAGNIQTADTQNVQNRLQNINDQNQWNKFKYGEEMKLKGAGMSSQAIANAGKK